jgi:hypothetical protein
MEPEKNPLIEWALHGKGKTPTKEELHALAIGLNESLTKTNNLLIEAQSHMEKAQGLKEVIELGLKKVITELNKPNA